MRSGALTLALPRGRPWQRLGPLLERAGVPGVAGADPEHQLIVVTDQTRLLFTRPADVVTYVREGVAQLGVTGKDVLLEDGTGVLELLDLPVGRWRMSVAAPEATDWPRLLAERGDGLRVATSYPAATAAFFADRGLNPQVLRLRGAVELAAVVGLADCIVDLVDSGRTLRNHGLREVEVVHPISLRLIGNVAAYRWQAAGVRELCTRLSRSLAADPGAGQQAEEGREQSR